MLYIILQSLAYQQVKKPDPKHTKKMGAIFTFSILQLLILLLFQVSKFESVCKFAQQSNQSLALLHNYVFFSLILLL